MAEDGPFQYWITRPVGRLKNFIRPPDDENEANVVPAGEAVFRARSTFITDTVFSAWHLLAIYLRSEADDWLSTLDNDPLVSPAGDAAGNHRMRKGLNKMIQDTLRIIATDGDRGSVDPVLLETYTTKLQPTMMTGYHFEQHDLPDEPPNNAQFFAPQPTLPPGKGGRIIGCTSSTTQQPTDHLATPPITSTPPTNAFDTTTKAAASTTQAATLAAYVEHDPAKRDSEKNQEVGIRKGGKGTLPPNLVEENGP
ncbi:uncharacterized protein EV422DRAFT_502608 [Fimicolochytrium jonesii]|uniref:uncharacterized protein n=1 Tax=Fimicolochytrium jonesii TaxID=1396493 RepID=UPI0022FE5FA4|nr:uncharacterized protein EV422DRAFT_502608 [Fimicolochytrium jonesii]KAI8826872.1 hypothetical protein EV422DRAFT_502608 [Fimicolochytrium jonesii]